ncbi:Mitochondrial import inner membrane translocase subunit TIM44 [Strongyloides ratti]|uniref:Mitochondrial import inner membrane translocase subunit TIM44 n=1 Tax=Strongyloides ratti TaxID=34506 RepID=A0A090MXQ5_STRRB|nr:Mitochondrial import inner membrane translocase subunit TIM44 [Strongyloides ratti]CEF65844.1 Mitochondrial import inner membrane translocase subunit TIM44 [Strongyloides ratti]
MRNINNIKGITSKIFLNSNSTNFILNSPPIRLSYLETQKRFNSGRPGPRKGFFSNFVNNLREELSKNEDLKKNSEALEKRLKELQETEALKEARKKFDIVEKETFKGSDVVKHKVIELKDHVKKAYSEFEKTEAGKKVTEAGAEAIKKAKEAAEIAGNVAGKVGETEVYKHVSDAAKEIDKIADVHMYKKPEQLQMRTSELDKAFANRPIKANTEATGITLHKNAKWYAGWKEYTEKNPYYNKLLDLKMKYDESDNLAVRMLRNVTEKLSTVFTTNSPEGEVLREVCKMDPSFNVDEWLKFVEKQIIPNILEAYIRNDLKVLESWCHERAYKVLAMTLKEFQEIGYNISESKVIDVSKVELNTGKMMEQGPVFVISFHAFMINVVKNREGKIIQGDDKNPVRVTHIWVMCRDMEEYNPATAWKVLEIHMHESPILF